MIVCVGAWEDEVREALAEGQVFWVYAPRSN